MKNTYTIIIVLSVIAGLVGGYALWGVRSYERTPAMELAQALTQEIKIIEQENSSFTDLSERATTSEDELARLEEENKGLSDQLKALAQEDDEIDQLRQDNVELTSQLGELKGLEDKSNAIYAENEALKTELETLKGKDDRIATLEEEQKTLTSKLDTLREKAHLAADLSAENNALKTELKSAKDEIAALGNITEALKSRLPALEKDAMQKAGLIKQNADLNARIKALEADNNELKERLLKIVELTSGTKPALDAPALVVEPAPVERKATELEQPEQGVLLDNNKIEETVPQGAVGIIKEDDAPATVVDDGVETTLTPSALKENQEAELQTDVPPGVVALPQITPTTLEPAVVVDSPTEDDGVGSTAPTAP